MKKTKDQEAKAAALEEALAQIVLKEGCGNVTEDDLKEFAKSRLARHKVPKYIEFTDAFPMNAAGKVLKYKMREDAIRRLGLTVKMTGRHLSARFVDYITQIW